MSLATKTPFRRLLITSSILFFLVFLITIVQISGGNYGVQRLPAVLWPVKHILPLLAIIGVASIILGKRGNRTLPQIKLLPIAKIASVTYQLIVLVALLAQPFVPRVTNETPLEKLLTLDPGLFILQILLLVIWGIWISAMLKSTPQPSIRLRKKPLVFISYSHADQTVAIELARKLEEKKIEVILDRDDMMAGELIDRFIIEGVKQSSATISIVSTHSLLSGYVAMETVNTFNAQILGDDKKFIGCYLDTAFMDADFTASSIESIDKKLSDIASRIDKLDSLKSDSKKLNAEKTRLIRLKNNMDDIVTRLNGSLSIDIRGDNLNKNFHQICKAIEKK